MDGCIYRTKDGECDLYSEGGKFKAFCDPEHCDNIAPSNADRIRAMSDEELAAFLMTDDFCELLNCESPCDGHCDSRMLDWRKQEVTE